MPSVPYPSNVALPHAQLCYCRREGKQILNVISLEFSGTALADRVKSPQAVREIDWIDKAWPASSANKPGCYPKTQYYCLMSVAGVRTRACSVLVYCNIQFLTPRSNGIFASLSRLGRTFTLIWVAHPCGTTF